MQPVRFVMSRDNSSESVTNALAGKPRDRRKHPRMIDKQAHIEIFFLGHLALRTDPKSAPTPLKRNSQPTALLQLLVTAGPIGIDKAEVELKLWPHAQIELADNTLDTTLYRLRKILGDHRAIEVDNGIVRLNENHAWVDAWNFAGEAETFCTRMKSTVRALAPKEIDTHCDRLFYLYRGHFLAMDVATPWIVQTRDALQSKFFRAIKLTGARWQTLRDWNRATQLYERALELDNLAEEIHRELMLCHLAQHEFAAVVNVFRRCRELLSLVLGVAPSEATEKVYRQALAQQSVL